MVTADAGLERVLRRSAAEVERFPVRAELRAELTALLDANGQRKAALVKLTEASTPLTAAVLRAANRGRRARGTVGSVAGAFATVGPHVLAAAIERLPPYDLFEPPRDWPLLPEQVRLHSVAVARTTERLAQELGVDGPHCLRAAAILHDIGKLLLAAAFPDAPLGYGDPLTTDARLERERALTGLDHAVAGGWLLSHWGLPERLATAVEGHHTPGAAKDAAILRLADLLVHFAAGALVDLSALAAAGEELGLPRGRLSRLIYELTEPLSRPEPKAEDWCPLSARELDVLRLLARGLVYKQIAAELGLSPSTVRSHLHRTYKRLNVLNRTQAVLLATELGWI